MPGITIRSRCDNPDMLRPEPKRWRVQGGFTRPVSAFKLPQQTAARRLRRANLPIFQYGFLYCQMLIFAHGNRSL